ncbi:hypothetical protein AGABI2DRAFT_175665 [Agaricus bisporus var. bisporus H97]|uniref:hypothetical protein n=1 Tax=Agaricus bisporus var. bisporus (strain H97 / ATCC MYA-4626 / FGSC 10389) TaxID=936046 RepID=UPI00029F69CB|nr:hypothetical protein AGABI2DRAFT_175665 [Agaricus bisporus var. bisporus H97]EKV50940.1 hypothetical protein AGABI2DRAFT_175665 [Agaricus bisporus var. bisporus H97]
MSSADIYSIPKTPPTSFLPPLKKLSTTSTIRISLALNTLRSIYFPPTPPPLPKKIVIPKRSALTLSNQNGLSSVPDSGYASATEDQEDLDDDEVEAWERPERDEEDEIELEVLRADGLERAFAIKWVTGFIARCDMWIESVDVGEDDEDDGIMVEIVEGEVEGVFNIEGEIAQRTKLMEDATTILSQFSTGEDEEDSSANEPRSFTFSSPSDQQITVELNDEPVSTQDHTSVGLQSWTSSILLAERIAASPFTFLPRHLIDGAKPIRVLELGAGTGLLSIVTAKILQHESIIDEPVSNTIIATDYHPDVLENLKKNIQTNFPDPSPLPPLSPSSTKSSSALPIEANYLDWANPRFDAPLDERFDVILAADVVYHPDHARWIKNCVEKYLRLPTQYDSDTRIGSEVSRGGTFWLMIAVRITGRHEGLDITVDECFREGMGNGPRLVIFEKKEVVKPGSYGRADEGSYRLYKIGWDNRL